jgi:hypothetical protein
LSVKALLVAIENWLMSQFALNSIDRHPRMEFATPQKISALRYRPFLSDQAGQVTASDETATSKQQDTVAVYYDATQTIYLPEGWTGESPAEMSVLVHEVVHHFQNLLGLKYECPPAREALAYLAQDQWLRLAGHDLATDFDLDPFTLLAKTKCLY